MKSQEFVFGLISKHHIRARFKHVLVLKFQHLRPLPSPPPPLLKFSFHACGKVCVKLIVITVIFIIYKCNFSSDVALLRTLVI